MIVLVGESASGKSSIQNELCDTYDFKKVVTYTTRQPREGEVDGVDYHFVSNEDFTALEKDGFFVETAVYNNWQYGTAKNDCIGAKSGDKIVILTPRGLRRLKKLFTVGSEMDLISFYIKVPRRDRLMKSLQRGDNFEESYRRNLSDVGMFDGIEDEVDYVVDNPGYNLSVWDCADMVVKMIKERCCQPPL